LRFYNASLEIEDNELTRNNRDYILTLLQETEPQEEEQPEPQEEQQQE